MPDPTLLAPWVRRFLLEHLIGERNLSLNTQKSYRDMLTQLLPFVAEAIKKPVDRLVVPDLSAQRIRLFLTHLERTRRCGASTRNQRLGGIHALARFVGEHSPEHLEWCSQIRLIPFKKILQPAITCLDRTEMNALLAAPERLTPQGQREHALLLFLYNSGARASEAAQLTIRDLDWHARSVQLLGKECHAYCTSFRRRGETTGTHAGRQACDLAFSAADVLPVVRRGIGVGPCTDAHGAGRVAPMSEPWAA